MRIRIQIPLFKTFIQNFIYFSKIFQNLSCVIFPVTMIYLTKNTDNTFGYGGGMIEMGLGERRGRDEGLEIEVRGAGGEMKCAGGGVREKG